MALCRCGCGAKIGRKPARMARRALYVASLLPALRRLETVLREHGNDTSQLVDFIGGGDLLVKRLLEGSHNQTGVSVQAAQLLEQWQREAHELCGQLATADPEWFATWHGPSDRGPLVTSAD